MSESATVMASSPRATFWIRSNVSSVSWRGLDLEALHPRLQAGEGAGVGARRADGHRLAGEVGRPPHAPVRLRRHDLLRRTNRTGRVNAIAWARSGVTASEPTMTSPRPARSAGISWLRSDTTTGIARSSSFRAKATASASSSRFGSPARWRCSGAVTRRRSAPASRMAGRSPVASSGAAAAAADRGPSGTWLQSAAASAARDRATTRPVMLGARTLQRAVLPDAARSTRIHRRADYRAAGRTGTRTNSDAAYSPATTANSTRPLPAAGPLDDTAGASAIASRADGMPSAPTSRSRVASRRRRARSVSEHRWARSRARAAGPLAPPRSPAGPRRGGAP